MSNAKTYQLVTDQIIEQLEAGVVPWRKTWAGSSGMPRSLATGKQYQGINVFLLAFAPFESPYWTTYNGAKKLGGHVRKGERGRRIILWKFIEPKAKKGEPKPEKGKKIPMLRSFVVFNVEQCDGLEVPGTEEPRTDAERHGLSERIVAGYIENGGPSMGEGRPCYVPAIDRVSMPRIEKFTGDAEYYSTLFHELAHSTGHQDRLGRFDESTTHEFGGADYSREELVAEMSAAFLCAAAGIQNESLIENQAAYLQSWIKTLKADPSALVWAGSRAQKAADHIIDAGDSGDDDDSDDDRDDAAPVAVGDTVRSYDFPGDRDHYTEGVVVSITDPANHPEFCDCPRYEIEATRVVWGGEETGKAGHRVFPPVNGTQTTTGRTTSGVVKEATR